MYPDLLKQESKKKMHQELKIETPCTEDWNKMSQNKVGRHCGICDKTVVDFTVMSKEDIANYISKKSQKQVFKFYQDSTIINALLFSRSSSSTEPSKSTTN